MGNSNTLFASLFWGSVGLGFLIYGKKQGAMVPLFGGVALMAISYFVSSAMYMCVAGAALVAAIIYFRNYGQ